MPNWVHNRLVAMGTEAQIHDFIKRTTARTDGKRTFDFNKIIPSPEVYTYDMSGYENTVVETCANGLMLDIKNHTDAPGYNDLVYYATDYLRCSINELTVPKRTYTKRCNELFELTDPVTHKQLFQSADDIRKVGIQLLNAYRKYGTHDWYGWCCHYWGTKWNVANGSMELAYNSSDSTAKTMTVSIEFDTAWYAPMQIYNRLFKDFPELKFDVLYANEEIGIGVGSITKHGEKAMYVTYEDDSNDAMTNAISLWELWDDYEFDNVTKQWAYIDSEE